MSCASVYVVRTHARPGIVEQTNALAMHVAERRASAISLYRFCPRRYICVCGGFVLPNTAYTQHLMRGQLIKYERHEIYARYGVVSQLRYREPSTRFAMIFITLVIVNASHTHTHRRRATRLVRERTCARREFEHGYVYHIYAHTYLLYAPAHLFLFIFAQARARVRTHKSPDKNADTGKHTPTDTHARI